MHALVEAGGSCQRQKAGQCDDSSKPGPVPAVRSGIEVDPGIPVVEGDRDWDKARSRSTLLCRLGVGCMSRAIVTDGRQDNRKRKALFTL